MCVCLCDAGLFALKIRYIEPEREREKERSDEVKRKLVQSIWQAVSKSRTGGGSLTVQRTGRVDSNRAEPSRFALEEVLT